MIKKCGYWNVNTRLVEKFGKLYYICSHSFNPTKIELVFITKQGLSGNNKQLVRFIENNFNM